MKYCENCWRESKRKSSLRHWCYVIDVTLLILRNWSMFWWRNDIFRLLSCMQPEKKKDQGNEPLMMSHDESLMMRYRLWLIFQFYSKSAAPLTSTGIRLRRRNRGYIKLDEFSDWRWLVSKFSSISDIFMKKFSNQLSAFQNYWPISPTMTSICK